MQSNHNPRAKSQSNFIRSDELLSMAAGRWFEILTSAGMPADVLRDRRGRACPRCGGVDRFCILRDFTERGAVLCRHCHNAGTEPRCGDGVATLRWWLRVDASHAIEWLADWLGVGQGSYWTGPIVRAVERRLTIPEQSAAPKRFALMAEVWRRNMRLRWLTRAAKLLGLPTGPLEQLQVGWSPEHRATSWPMRDAAGAVIGVRLRCPSTAKKWAVKGSAAGLFYPVTLMNTEHPERLMVCEGPTDTAAMLSVGLHAVGVPSAGGCCDLVTQLVRRLNAAEVVIVADADGPGLAGAERIAEALLIVARVRIVSPCDGAKDARAWVCGGADRAVIESAADRCSVRSIAMEGVSNE